MGRVVPETTDIPQILAAINLPAINIESWLESMTEAEIDELLAILNKNESRGLCDQSIKSYMKFIREYQNPQVAEP